MLLLLYLYSPFRNWLRAVFVAKDLDYNADSTSQLPIEPELLQHSQQNIWQRFTPI
jgi:hypothetical protein